MMEVMGDEAMIQWQFDMIYRQFVESDRCTQAREGQQTSSLSSDFDDNGDGHESDSSEANVLLSDNEHMPEGLDQDSAQNLTDGQLDGLISLSESDENDDNKVWNQSGFVRSRLSLQKACSDTVKGRLSDRKQSKLPQYSKDITPVKTSCASKLQLSKKSGREPNSLKQSKDNSYVKTAYTSKPKLSVMSGKQLKLQKHNSNDSKCTKRACASRPELTEMSGSQPDVPQRSEDNTCIQTACAAPRSRPTLKRRTQPTLRQYFKEAPNLDPYSLSETTLPQTVSTEGLEVSDLYECDSGICSGSSLQLTTEDVVSPSRVGGGKDNEGKACQSLSEHITNRLISPVVSPDSSSLEQEGKNFEGASVQTSGHVTNHQTSNSSACNTAFLIDPGQIEASDRDKPTSTAKADNPNAENKEGDVGNVSDADSVHSNASGYCATRRSPKSNHFTSHEMLVLGLKVKAKQHRRGSRGRFYRARRKHSTQHKNIQKPSSCHDPSSKQRRTLRRTSRGSAGSTGILSPSKGRRKLRGKSPGSAKDSGISDSCWHVEKKSKKLKNGCETAVSPLKTIRKQLGRKTSLTSREICSEEVEQCEQFSSRRQTRSQYLRNCKLKSMADSKYSEQITVKGEETRLSKQSDEKLCSREEDFLVHNNVARKSVSSEKEERRQLNRVCKTIQPGASRHRKKPEKFDGEEVLRKQKRVEKQAKKEKRTQGRACKTLRSGTSIEPAEKRGRQRLPEKRKSSEDMVSSERRGRLRKSARYKENHGPRTASGRVSPLVGLSTGNNHVADVSMNADDPLHRLSSLETVASAIDLNDMEQLMPASALESARRMVFASKSSHNLLTVQTVPVTLGQSSLFGPPRHIGAVWKSIMSEK